MKTLILTLAAAALTGCAVYPAGPEYGTYGVASPVYGPPGPPPVYLYGAGVYRYGGYPSPYAYPHAYPRGYYGFRHGGVPNARVHPDFHGPRHGFGGHDGGHNRSGRQGNHQGRR